MRFAVLSVCLSGLVVAVIAGGAPVLGQPLPAPSCAPAGSPGTATPMPYPPLTPRPLPAPAYHPPLLKSVEPLPPRDRPIPLLEQQLRRNSESPRRAPASTPTPQQDPRE